jgi:hypothetical protein
MVSSFKLNSAFRTKLPICQYRSFTTRVGQDDFKNDHYLICGLPMDSLVTPDISLYLFKRL